MNNREHRERASLSEDGQLDPVREPRDAEADTEPQSDHAGESPREQERGQGDGEQSSGEEEAGAERREQASEALRQRAREVLKAQDRVAALAAEAEKTSVSMQQAREALGVESSKEPEAVIADDFQREEEKLARLQEALAQAERDFLGVPEAEAPEEDAEAEELAEAAQYAFEELARSFEEALKEARQRALDQWIEDGIAYFTDQFSRLFKESRNGKRAEELLAVKTDELARHALEDWVETGTLPPGLGGIQATCFSASMEVEEGNVRYIERIAVEAVSKEELKADVEEKDLLNSGERNGLAREDQRGGVEHEESAA